MIAELGALLWPRLAAAYLEARLAPHPPADGAAGVLLPILAAPPEVTVANLQRNLAGGRLL